MILNKEIIFIAIVRCIGSLVRVIILKYQYNSSYLGKLENKSVKLDIELIVKIIDESKYLWFSFVSFLIYTQTDRLMINHYLGVEEVGVYTTGMRLSSILAILIGPIQNSLFPKFLELYGNDYQKYYKFYKLTNTIITQFIALFLIDFFIKEYQEQAIIQLKSLNLIYLIKEIKKYLKKE